jgi:hypothetical protein
MGITLASTIRSVLTPRARCRESSSAVGPSARIFARCRPGRGWGWRCRRRVEAAQRLAECALRQRLDVGLEVRPGVLRQRAREGAELHRGHAHRPAAAKASSTGQRRRCFSTQYRQPARMWIQAQSSRPPALTSRTRPATTTLPRVKWSMRIRLCRAASDVPSWGSAAGASGAVQTHQRASGPASTGNSLISPSDMISTATAARIRPISRVITLMPTLPIMRAMLPASEKQTKVATPTTTP